MDLSLEADDSSRLAATSACSASISATMACCVARGGRERECFRDALIDLWHTASSANGVSSHELTNGAALENRQQIVAPNLGLIGADTNHQVTIDVVLVVGVEDRSGADEFLGVATLQIDVAAPAPAGDSSGMASSR